jgi:hypothetical protein
MASAALPIPAPSGRAPQRRTRSLCGAALLAIAGNACATTAVGVSHDSEPARASAQVRVVVAVPRVLTLRMIRQPATVELRRADIERGYVEATLELAVHCNVREGYSLMLSHDGAFATGVVVHGLGGALPLEPSGYASRPSPGRGLATETLQLTFRFTLPADAREGSHPWPIRLASAAL